MIKRVSCKLWQFCGEKAMDIWCFWVKFSDFKAARSYWNSKVMKGKSLFLEGMSHCWKLSLENKSCPFPLPFNIKKRITTEDLTSGISCELVTQEDRGGNCLCKCLECAPSRSLNVPHWDQLKAVGRNGKTELQILLNGLARVSRGSQLCFIWPNPINVIHGVATLWISSPPSVVLNY